MAVKDDKTAVHRPGFAQNLQRMGIGMSANIIIGLKQRHFGACLFGQIPGSTETGNTAANHCHLHDTAPSRI